MAPDDWGTSVAPAEEQEPVEGEWLRAGVAETAVCAREPEPIVETAIDWRLFPVRDERDPHSHFGGGTSSAGTWTERRNGVETGQPEWLDVASVASPSIAHSLLERVRPDLSAKTGPTARQKLVLAGVVLGGMLLAGVAPLMATAALQGLFAVSFALLLGLRILAIREALRPERERFVSPAPSVTQEVLPVYTVLVALYDEAAVVAQLLRALGRIDYPRDRLDIIFVLEADDATTWAALARAGLGEDMRCVVVPDGVPRTKPRALDYALGLARGSHVVVFDAEDEPEPQQLRQAVAAFATGGDRLGCVQARLNIYNRRESWLTAQFSIEYTALFDAVLPAYARYGLPVPLGGTSNHIRGIR